MHTLSPLNTDEQLKVRNFQCSIRNLSDKATAQNTEFMQYLNSLALKYGFSPETNSFDLDNLDFHPIVQAPAASASSPQTSAASNASVEQPQF